MYIDTKSKDTFDSLRERGVIHFDTQAEEIKFANIIECRLSPEMQRLITVQWSGNKYARNDLIVKMRDADIPIFHIEVEGCERSWPSYSYQPLGWRTASFLGRKFEEPPFDVLYVKYNKQMNQCYSLWKYEIVDLLKRNVAWLRNTGTTERTDKIIDMPWSEIRRGLDGVTQQIETKILGMIDESISDSSK
jgi:hypothetical protein